MTTFLLGLYVLIWPAMALAVLAVILWATAKDVREASKEGRKLV